MRIIFPTEWVEALEQVIDAAGLDSAAYLLEQLSGRAREIGVELPLHLNTPYINTIRPEDEVLYPGDRAAEHRITSFIRWNALAMVVTRKATCHRANRPNRPAESRTRHLPQLRLWRRRRHGLNACEIRQRPTIHLLNYAALPEPHGDLEFSA